MEQVLVLAFRLNEGQFCLCKLKFQLADQLILVRQFRTLGCRTGRVCVVAVGNCLLNDVAIFGKQLPTRLARFNPALKTSANKSQIKRHASVHLYTGRINKQEFNNCWDGTVTAKKQA